MGTSKRRPGWPIGRWGTMYEADQRTTVIVERDYSVAPAIQFIEECPLSLQEKVVGASFCGRQG